MTALVDTKVVNIEYGGMFGRNFFFDVEADDNEVVNVGPTLVALDKLLGD